MNEPYGGTLINRLVTGDRALALEEEAGELPVLRLNAFETSDLEMLATGALSPLEGFMARADYESVLLHKRLASGVPWTLPVTLAVTSEQARNLEGKDRVTLADPGGQRLAVLTLTEGFRYDRETEARQVFRTTDTAHPGVAYVRGRGDWLVGGTLEVFRRPQAHPFRKYRLDPVDTRRIFAERGWKTVVGFQTREPRPPRP